MDVFEKNKGNIAQILLVGMLAMLLQTQCAGAEISLTTLVNFDGTNGYIPQSGLVEGRDGNFYGTLSYGGWYDLGTLFRMAPSGACVVLVTFDGANGSHPDSLLQGKDGNFYGATLQGGVTGDGSIFKMTPDGRISTVASFADYVSGVGPGGLVQGQDGHLYGRTSLGGPGGHGSTFRLTPTGELTIPATNSALAAGSELLKGKDGDHYGTTFAGSGDGTSRFGFGTVFRKTPDGTVATLVSFNVTNGANPVGELVQDRDGNIYGVTTRGGAFNQGTIFRLNLATMATPASTLPKINVPVLIHAVSNNIDPRIMDAMQAPIDFYGKAVDESSNAIPAANITFQWNDLTARGYECTATTQSDLEGLFSLREKHGSSMSVSVGKNGYYGTHTSQQTFWYGKMEGERRHVPDARKPIAFFLRKRGGGANALVTSQHGMRDGFWATVPKDGKPLNVDLLNQKTGSGPLEITQKKPDFPVHHAGTIESLSPSDRAKWMSATNWSFTMRISDGGFIEENDEFPFNPPETGYESAVNYSFQKGQKDWTGNWSMNFQKNYYIKFGSPALYGQLHLETWADSDKVILTYVINPDGSRNLEPKQGYFPSSSHWTH